jgi:hypothetical protein
MTSQENYNHYPDPMGKKWMEEWSEKMAKREQEALYDRALRDMHSYSSVQFHTAPPSGYYTAYPAMTAPKRKTPSPRKRGKALTNDRLKAFLDAKRIDSIILGDVARYLQSAPNERDQTLIHPSEMAKKDWCPRSTWLRLTGHTQAAEVHSLRTELIFAEGHDIHRKWQTWLSKMGVLYGAWYCPACEATDLCEVLELPTVGCPNQRSGKHLWEYREVPLKDAARNIGGHADGIVLNPEGDALLEAKSVGPGTLRKLGLLSEEESDEDTPDKFSRITHILGDHFRQIQIYLRLSQNSGRPVKRAVAIYENKADQQVREFVIDYDESATDSLFNTAADIMWAIDKGRDVDCVEGAGRDCAECRGWEQP